MQCLGVLSLFLSVFAMLLLFFRATNRWCLSFGMSLLGLLIWDYHFGKSVFLNALRLHLSDLMHK
jgi:hypothetical protein